MSPKREFSYCDCCRNTAKNAIHLPSKARLTGVFGEEMRFEESDYSGFKPFEQRSMDLSKKRIKNPFRSDVFAKVSKKPVNYYYEIICVVDYEATCDKETCRDLIQEIIEFPAFLVDVRTKEIVGSFHEFVRPQVNPKLSQFCTELTGITQEMVDRADTFPVVLDRFENWFYSYLSESNCTSFAIATDGPWDMAHFFSRQCQLNRIAFPSYCKRWINLRKVFSSHYKTHHFCLNQMLTHLNIEFQGRRHSGFDDALNIAHVLIRLLIDGANPVINERISWHQVDRSCWGDLRCGYVRVFYNKPSDGLNVSDSEESEEEEEKYENNFNEF
ncbi:exoribonuclease 1-like protein [Dinothrombium tinctorium]|uniref:Exoribonuclease 1-like protein n=1 Tax=Dinothrombium tinctorium TaxID=1965070 RepID=A0A3S3P7F7_9ACAR|nr:exoribonuclease 1-like protein [Dinothrombium tinctorium]RWS16517.1 exoribonuclease 1-like protein [Dinothrombium tinctorium]RWS16528.1 exoribonuclease 1-like protein [Dinothrombium tinctorium]